MNSQLVIAILAGLGGMLGWGLADLFAKKTIDAIGDMASLLWAHLFGTGILFVVMVWKVFSTGIRVPTTAHDIVLLIFFGVLQAAVYLLVYRGFGKGQVSVLNPVFASFSGITALISIFIFGELVTGSVIWALVLVFGGVILLNLDPVALKEKRFNFIHVPGFKEVGVATLLAAVWTIGWDRFIGGHDWVTYAFFMYAFMTLAIYVYTQKQKVSLLVSVPSMWKLLFFIGLAETVAYLAISWGYEVTTHTSVVALLSGAFSLPTILLARVYLKEKTTRIQGIGAGIIILGIIILSVV